MDVQQCRTCLSTNELKPIFQNPENSDKYTRLLYTATGLKIVHKDKLPQTICKKCITTINSYMVFRQQCFDTQQKLLTNNKKVLTNTISKKETKKIEYNEDIHSEDFDYDLNETFECSNAEKTDETQKSNIEERTDDSMPYKEFESTVREVLKRNIAIDFINFVQGRKVSLQYVNVDKVEDKEVVVEKKQMEPLQCKFCPKVLKSKPLLLRHHRIHTQRNIICEHCGKKFLTKRHYITHCRSKHGYQKTDKCSYCEYRGNNPEQVKIHERVHTGERPYACALCGAAFHRRSTYLQHLPIHLPTKTVQCPECPSMFKSVTLMKIHRNRHRTRRTRDLARNNAREKQIQ